MLSVERQLSPIVLEGKNPYIISTSEPPPVIPHVLSSPRFPDEYPLFAKKRDNYSRERIREKKDSLSFTEDLSKSTFTTFEPAKKRIDHVLVDGYTGVTQDREHWFIALPQTPVDALAEPQMLNGLQKELENRQCRIRPRKGANVEHEQNILVFLANWGKISKIFYNEPPPITRHLPRFREVDLNDFVLAFKNSDDAAEYKRLTCGMVDFVGVGPDGRLIIVDFGSGKTKTLYDNALGLQSVMQELPHQQVLPIASYVANYDIGNRTNTILIHPSKFSPHLFENGQKDSN